MTKKSVKLPRMTGQQVYVMCHLALGSKVRRDQIRVTPPRYEYPLSWVLGNGYWKRHGKVSAKTINALMRKDMVHFRDGEIRAFKKVLSSVKAQHNETFQSLGGFLEYLNSERQKNQTKEQIEMQGEVDGAEEKAEENLDQPQMSFGYDKAYNALANRLMSAFGEVNDALQEAFEMDIMTVRVGTSPMNDDGPAQFYPRIFRRTHARMEWQIKIKARVEGGPPLTEAEHVPV